MPFPVNLDTAAQNRRWVLLAAASLAVLCGCSSAPLGLGDKAGADGSVDLIPAFVGTWAYDAGTWTTACPGVPPVTMNLGGVLVISGDATSGYPLLVNQPGACAWPFGVTGDVALIAPALGCTFPHSNGGADIFSNTNWSLTLAPDQQSLAEQLESVEVETSPNATPTTCRYSENGATLRRTR
jgi:hypothetical protein